jgi:hypothetical protein
MPTSESARFVGTVDPVGQPDGPSSGLSTSCSRREGQWSNPLTPPLSRAATRALGATRGPLDPGDDQAEMCRCCTRWRRKSRRSISSIAQPPSTGARPSRYAVTLAVPEVGELVPLIGQTPHPCPRRPSWAGYIAGGLLGTGRVRRVAVESAIGAMSPVDRARVLRRVRTRSTNGRRREFDHRRVAPIYRGCSPWCGSRGLTALSCDCGAP